MSIGLITMTPYSGKSSQRIMGIGQRPDTFLVISDEIKNIFKSIQFMNANEKIISSKILNSELSEYTTKVSIEKPNGDTISFY